MARQRRMQGLNSLENDKGTNSSSSNASSSSGNKAKNVARISPYWKHVIGFLCFAVAVTVGYMGYLETRVNTPFDEKKLANQYGTNVPERFWGTYRPGVYFGLKTRDPHSLVTGLMWYFPRRLKPGGEGIRHWCEQGDNLERYGWLKHDGSNFGTQEIVDGPFVLTTSFVKQPGGANGGEWTARIVVDAKPEHENVVGEEVSLLWYTALDENTKGAITPSNIGSSWTGVKGETSSLGEFTIKIFNTSGAVEHESYLSTVAPGLHLLRETVITSLRLTRRGPETSTLVVLAGELLASTGGTKAEPNFVATQLTGRIPFALDVVFESGSFKARENSLVGSTYTSALKWHESRFEQRFENTFGLKEKSYTSKEIGFAQAALSNMIGGIGYFYGSSRVQSSYTKEPVPYWKAPLYTAVPSRSFFPRGFLWDEGFHGLLISTWDLDIELDIMNHWFDLMNVEGWIPREQILGVEALAKVPEEFVTQHNTNANPPTFFLTLEYILRRYKAQLVERRLENLDKLYPRLQAWFSWFNTTQKGPTTGTYRWRGRDPTTNRELNPKTLTSGLDDYPRASHPTDDERHIDLRCWISMAADTLGKLATVVNRNGYKYEETYEYLREQKLLDEMHWSDYSGSYADYGFHTDSVALKRPKPNSRSQTQSLEMVRVVTKAPEFRLVDSMFGYVSLFPFVLQMLEPDSPKLEKILSDIRDPNLIWSKFGLRSLSKGAPLYMKRNTEHDPPYWRGQIWVNVNFLTVRALHYYGHTKGPFREDALKIYKELRANLIKNVMEQYFKTGYIWEQYNDRTGEGSGCRPFTGWSALVVLLMGEQF